MLKGLKLVTPPASLIPLEGGVMEAEVLSVVSCPTAMVCKWITSLLEEQRQAARITDQQVLFHTHAHTHTHTTHTHTHTPRPRAPGLALLMPWGSCRLDVESRGLPGPCPTTLCGVWSSLAYLPLP